jgi:dolichol-phosphate mannosyltransferase
MRPPHSRTRIGSAAHPARDDAEPRAPEAPEQSGASATHIAAAAATQPGASTPRLSVVVPAYNEAGNLPALVTEILAALRGVVDFEIVCIDDASSDNTLDALQALRAQAPELRIVHHAARSGQSTAIRSGVRAARGAWIATLDGDGQNDPADIPRLLQARDAAAAGVRLFAGWRVQRRDSGGKRWASRWANAIRARLLGDDTPDTGCGTKLFERAAFLDLPYFDHMHRFLPALMQRAGWRTVSVPVNHRPRASGVSKYDNLGRALVGIVDLCGVLWLMRRSKLPRAEEV